MCNHSCPTYNLQKKVILFPVSTQRLQHYSLSQSLLFTSTSRYILYTEQVYATVRLVVYLGH